MLYQSRVLPLGKVVLKKHLMRWKGTRGEVCKLKSRQMFALFCVSSLWIHRKLKSTLEQSTKAHRVDYSSTLPSTSTLDWGEVGGQRDALAALLPGRSRYSGPVWRGCGEWFDRRTVQHVASRYTDWATPALAVRGESLYRLSYTGPCST